MSPELSTAGETAFSAVHSDIIRSHILTRLDGPALSALTCASAQLSALATDEDLWRAVSTATWPSTSDPRVRDAVSSFTSGHRSLFSDSFPVLHHSSSDAAPKSTTYSGATSSSVELISAVDLYYKKEVIFSKVLVSETESGWFHCSPFRVDLLGPKDSVPTRIWNPNPTDDWLNHLEENLSLSWIVIDPARKRAANLSTRDPISVQRHWLTGDVQVKYSTVVGGGGRRGSAAEMVQFGATVTLSGGKKGGDEVQVTEVSLQAEDMEGRSLNGRESLGILQAAMDGGKRKKWERGQGKARFEEYEERRRDRKREQQRKERALDLVCVVTGVASFVAFWTYILFR